MVTIATAGGTEIDIARLFESGSFKHETEVQISEQEMACLVHDLGASWQTGPFVWQRRRGHRTAYTDEVLLIPLEASGQPTATLCRVRGKELSAHGMSFTHADPIPYRFVVLVCELPSGISVIQTRLKWCRFTRNGLYESGGEFLRVVPLAPTAGDNDTPQ